MPKPKLLFLSQVLPYPPDGGVKIRTYNILRLLAQSFDVTALCFYRWKPGLHEQDIDECKQRLSELGDVEVFPIPQEHSWARKLWDHIRSLLTGRVYTYYTYESLEYRRALLKHLGHTSFDIVHVDSLDLSYYLETLENLHGRTVLVHHDIQSDLLRRRAEAEGSRLVGAYLVLQSRLMAKEEKRCCPSVSLNVVVSERDAEALSDVSPSIDVNVVPNGVDTDYFVSYGEGEEARRARKEVVFVGGLSWFPNLDALEYFGEEILPLLREKHQEVSVTWVGRAREEENEKYRNRYGIKLTGYVEDIRPYVKRAACYVVPIRVGGGTRIKILDAWSMGKAIVSTSVGCEGLEAIHGENILIADDPEGFTGAVSSVLQDEELRSTLGRRGRRTVEDHYSWSVIAERQQEIYAALLDELKDGVSESVDGPDG